MEVQKHTALIVFLISSRLPIDIEKEVCSQLTPYKLVECNLSAYRIKLSYLKSVVQILIFVS